MVSKYSRVALWEDVLASPQSNVISGTQAKQTSFYKYCYTSKSVLVFRTKKLRMLCICKRQSVYRFEFIFHLFIVVIIIIIMNSIYLFSYFHLRYCYFFSEKIN